MVLRRRLKRGAQTDTTDKEPIVNICSAVQPTDKALGNLWDRPSLDYSFRVNGRNNLGQNLS